MTGRMHHLLDKITRITPIPYLVQPTEWRRWIRAEQPFGRGLDAPADYQKVRGSTSITERVLGPRCLAGGDGCHCEDGLGEPVRCGVPGGRSSSFDCRNSVICLSLSCLSSSWASLASSKSRCLSSSSRPAT